MLWAREQSLQPVETPEQRAAFEVRLGPCRAHRRSCGARPVRAGGPPDAVDLEPRHDPAGDREWRVAAADRHRCRDVSATLRRWIGAPGRADSRRDPTKARPWSGQSRSHFGQSRTFRPRGPIAAARSSATERRSQSSLADRRPCRGHCGDRVHIPCAFAVTRGCAFAHASDNSLDSPGLHSHLSKLGVGKIVDLVQRSMTHKCDRFAEPNAERAEVESGWRHALALHDRQLGLRRSLEAAERAWHEERSEEAFARICELQGLLGQFAEPDGDDQTAKAS